MKRALALILATMMMVALVACGGGTTSATSSEHTTTDLEDIYKGQETTTPDATTTYKKEVTVAHWQAIDSIDPHLKNGNCAECIYKMLHSQLVDYDWTTGSVAPDLAESWDIESASSYVFHLRKDVKFSNGEPLTADDVIYSFVERPAAVQGTTGSAVWKTIEKVEAIDEHTVRFTLKAGDADFLNRLYLAYYCILNREACESDPDKGYTVGVGGWKLDEFKANDQISFLRYDDSWVWKEKGETPTEKVTIRFITEKTTSAIAVQNREVAAMSDVQNSDLAPLKSAGANALTYESEIVYFMIFNMKSGKFKDSAELRKAVAYALNYDEIIAFMTDGLGTRAYSMWGKSQYGLYEDFDEKYEYNVAKAKEYLTKAGYPDGLTVDLLCKEAEQGIGPLVQAQLKEIGITVNVQVSDTAGANATVKAGTFDMYFNGISLQPIGGRFAFIPDISHSTNRAFYDNPEMLAKFTAAGAETDDAKRKEIYKEIQIQINDEIPYLAMYYPASSVAYCEGVTGVLWEADAKPDYSGVRWAE